MSSHEHGGSALHRRPLRVLHLIPSLTTAGAEQTLVRLVEGLGAVRHLIVCLGAPGELAGAAEMAGARVLSLGATGPGAATTISRRLWQTVRRAKPDVLQTWMYHSDILGGFVGRCLGVPVVWNVRTTVLEPTERALTRGLVRAAAGLSWVVPAEIVYNAEAALTAHRRMGFTNRVGRVIANGVPIPSEPAAACRTAARARLCLSEEDFVIGRVARYAGVKDFPTMASAMGRIVREVPHARLVLCGKSTGAGNAALTEMLERAGITGHTIRLGRQDDMASVYPAMDVVCSPSAAEGFPNTIAEAMAWGLPVVGTDVGDTAPVIGDTGRVIPPRDPGALAAAVIELARQPSLRADLGRAARERTSTLFSEAGMLEAYGLLYAKVAAGAP